MEAQHLASAEFLRRQRQPVELASHDERTLRAAEAMGIPVWPRCRPGAAPR